MSKDKEVEKLFLLLDELSENRSNLHKMLGDVVGFRKIIDELLPKKIDYKLKYLLPERIKTVTEVIKSELAIRKQIDESVKMEVELRKKAKDEGEGKRSGDVKALAQALEVYHKTLKEDEESEEIQKASGDDE